MCSDLTHCVALQLKSEIYGPAWIKLHLGETGCSGGIGYGFIDQQNGNVVPNWINPLACAAFQALSVLFQGERFLADRTDEDVQQAFGDHGFTYTTFGQAQHAPTATRIAQLTFTARASKFPQR